MKPTDSLFSQQIPKERQKRKRNTKNENFLRSFAAYMQSDKGNPDMNM
jgi:hypothetical protein